MKATTSVWFAILAAAVAAAAARGAESGEFRVDARPSYGGRVGTGVEWVGEADGSALRQWDTTALPDGWTTLESGGSAAEVCVLNGPDVAGGRVDSDETWGADRVHVVRDDVVVGEGAVLTLERGAVVKFTEGARIVVEEGGDVVARGAYLADAADDSVGGDTNLDGGDTLPGAVEWWLEDEVVGDLIGVSFVGGGTDLPKRTYSAGETYGALPVPEDEAAIFGGWFTKPGGDGARVSASTRVNARVTALYAKWTPYSVGVEPMSVAAAPTGGTYRVAVSAKRIPPALQPLGRDWKAAPPRCGWFFRLFSALSLCPLWLESLPFSSHNLVLFILFVVFFPPAIPFAPCRRAELSARHLERVVPSCPSCLLKQLSGIVGIV